MIGTQCCRLFYYKRSFGACFATIKLQLVNPDDEGHGNSAQGGSNYIDNAGIFWLIIKKRGHADAGGSGRGGRS